MSSSLSLFRLIRETSPDRHKKATDGLHDGSLVVTLTRHTESEIRALVKNGDGIEYGLTLTEHGPFCSCKDALYRGAVCKHAVATALFCLQQQEVEQKRIHLMWESGAILCGHTPTPTTRFWRRWTLNALNWTDIVCQPCVSAWTHPQTIKAAA